MPNARGSVFIFIFMAIGIVSLVTMAALISQSGAPSASTATNSSVYFDVSQNVNHTASFNQNLTSAGIMGVSPLPLLMAIFVIIATAMMMLVVVKKR